MFIIFNTEQMFNPPLKQKTCLAFYNPKRRFREVCQLLTGEKLKVVNATKTSKITSSGA